jgi:hypothetical protein
MSVELDHFFICASAGATEADHLAELGFTEGAPNRHPGQGTACRRFFFRNAYLELLWVDNPLEAQSASIRSTGLWGRWSGRGSGACPFGLCFRPVAQPGGDPPFATWKYRAPYLPEGMSFQVGNNAHVLTEPGLFHLAFAFGRRPDAYRADKRQPLEHSAGLSEITRVELTSPYADRLSPELRGLTGAGMVRVRKGADYVAELAFDGESQGQKMDFRPMLPLVFRF